MSEVLLQSCSLTPVQQIVITNGINVGLAQYAEFLSTYPKTKTSNYKPKLRGDIINSAIESEILKTPEAGLSIENKKASFFEYIVLRDLKRKITILVQHLPETRYIMPHSKYRGEFTLHNVDRLISEGVEIEQLELDLGDCWQTSLPMDPEYFQFNVIVCYDGSKGENVKIYEGSLAPSQDEWIYRKEITFAKTNNILHADVTEETQVPRLKQENTDYGLKLKNIK